MIFNVCPAQLDMAGGTVHTCELPVGHEAEDHLCICGYAWFLSTSVAEKAEKVMRRFGIKEVFVSRYLAWPDTWWKYTTRLVHVDRQHRYARFWIFCMRWY